MIQVNNLFNNNNIKLIAQHGHYQIIEHQEDKSVTPYTAATAYFMQKMNVKRRQLLCTLNGEAVKIQAGAMQWHTGGIQMNSNVGGLGGLMGKVVKASVTGESAVKPLYQGAGYLMLEPTYNHLLIEDVASWGPQGMVLDDGLFLACDANIQESINRRTNLSSAALGGEGLFNLCLTGQGAAVLESNFPREELLEVVMENDEIRIDGNMAIAWSGSLQFTVEKSTKSLIGSGLSGEGFVNVYRGTGKVLMAPTMGGTTMVNNNGPEQTSNTSSHGLLQSVASSVLGG